jgi:hypothetical protein
MINKKELINEVAEKLRSQPGFDFEPKIIEEIINGGIDAIPNGDIIQYAGANIARKEGNNLVIYKRDKNNNEVKISEIPIEGNEKNILASYASIQSQKNRGSSFGTPKS